MAEKLSEEKFEERMQQAEEMAKIWENNNEIVQAYLRGCISTATAILGSGFIGNLGKQKV
jgi:hypothetical protein